MAKKVETKVKLQIPAGAANPAPPIGPALGGAGVNIGEFVTRFNSETSHLPPGEITPVEISVYGDRTFDFILKTPPASRLILKAAGIAKGSGKNALSKVGKINKDQVKEIAEKKMVDLNAADIEGAMKIIEGTARSMGIDVK